MRRALYLGLLLAACAGQPAPGPSVGPQTDAADLAFDGERWAEAMAAYEAGWSGGAVLTAQQRIRAAVAAHHAGDDGAAFVWFERALAGGAPEPVLRKLPFMAPLVADPRWAEVAARYAHRCQSEAHRGLDFWLGEWTVRTRDGEVAGTNVITRDLGGCRVLERWRGATGGQGSSVNWYDPAEGRWHQLWLDEGGNSIHYVGGPGPQGEMVLMGDKVLPDGTRLKSRMRLAPEPEGVHQLIELSPDGRRWQPWFEASYRRR
ncbi:MAG: hypothetical protein H6730_23360 [Deltaproteobacteria bacterium]|nr:hypothetical protein [Deltaproteobacteria bacterium]